MATTGEVTIKVVPDMAGFKWSVLLQLFGPYAHELLVLYSEWLESRLNQSADPQVRDRAVQEFLEQLASQPRTPAGSVSVIVGGDNPAVDEALRKRAAQAPGPTL